MNVTRGELQWSWSRTYGLQGRIVQVKSAEAQCPTLTWCENWVSGLSVKMSTSPKATPLAFLKNHIHAVSECKPVNQRIQTRGHE
ncbi:hypothetical protein TNCV_4979061 [Trichonephila clavipes]|nr:hypothetical protein TNCV_4979061 [Trichonephila clavipes]